MNQLTQHEDSFGGVFRQGFVGPLDGIFHPKAKAEMTGDHITDGAKIESGGLRSGALICSGQSLNRFTQSALVKCARGWVLLVDITIPIPFDAEAVDVIVFAKMKVRDRNEVRPQLVQNRR